MKNKELFDKTVNVLVKAYQNDELKHGDCHACAVGNICKEASNITRIPVYTWKNLFVTAGNFGQRRAFDHGIINYPYDDSFSYSVRERALTLIKATGYTVRELAKIEFSFEYADQGNNEDEWMFNGLLAVYDTLCDIHDINKEEVEKGELVFVKA